MSTEKEIRLVMEAEKETKNTLRFAEVERDDGLPAVAGTLYVQKYWLRRLGSPQRIEVVVRPL